MGKAGILSCFVMTLITSSSGVIDENGQIEEGLVEIPICPIRGELCFNLAHSALREYPNFRNLTTPQLIERLGYPVEIHTVITQDGYILTVHRVSHSTKSPPRRGKIPVFLMHGFSASSAQWMWQPPNKCLLFMLVDAGFDVWIGNARGTQYSLGHRTLSSGNPQDIRYWDFSFHEMGVNDIPAVIDHITRQTGEKSMYYVGHSMGTTQFFVAMMMRPDLAPRIRTMFSLATSAFQKRATNLFFRALGLILAIYPAEQAINKAFAGQLLPYLIRQFITTDFCSKAVFDCGICFSVYSLMFGVDPCQVDFSALPGILAHLPDTSSVKSPSHLAQDMVFGTFSQYNYGPVINLKKYGTANPPDYDWSKYHVPTVIYYGLADNLAVQIDVLKTASRMGTNLKKIHEVEDPGWDHLDFVFGKDADRFLYKDMLHIMLNQTFG